MAERKGGLGSRGLERTRQNLGGSVAGHEVTAYERSVYGAPRSTPSSPKTPWEYPDSSRCYAYSYDFDESKIYMRFIKYGTPWVYEDVMQPTFAAFDSAPSKGKAVNSLLNYTTYRRATPQEEATHFDHQ